MKNGSDFGIIICSPVFNDWDSAIKLLDKIDRIVHDERIKAELLFVDDFSTEVIPEKLKKPLQGIEKVEVLRLRRNLGHQRAIAIGLTFIAVHRSCRAVVVMDADGEDSANDIPRLIDHCTRQNDSCVVFAKRQKRPESLGFEIFYKLYKVLHRILTGRRVEVGNFSIIPASFLQSLIAVSSLWNHYAASVFQSKIPVDMIPADRDLRLAGQSKMNFVSLVTHGLSAISVYSEDVGVRLCVATSALAILNFILIGLVFLIRLFTDLAIPGWATATVAALAIILLQVVALSVVFVFLTLQGRNNLSFLPIRDFEFFVASLKELKYFG